MPDKLETDPKKGFVAFPMSVFDLDLTPGAFRTLAELCRMANLEGKCWPSLKQLGERLGRSRAAVSGYIAELRDAGLIETETQKMANGYNYRLRYRVVFWAEWRKQLGQTSERSVKPTERPLKTQNQSHLNQSPAKAGMDDLVLAWKGCVGRAPYPAFDTWPSEELLEKTALTDLSAPIISADIISEYADFLRRRGIDPTNMCQESRALLQLRLPDQQSMEAFLGALESEWKPHWAKPPTLTQIKRLLRSMPPQNSPAAQAKLLASYLKRWDIYAQSLSLAPGSAKVAA